MALLVAISCLLTLAWGDVIYLKTVNRYKRDTNQRDIQIQFSHQSLEYSVYLRKNDRLVTDSTLVEWNFENGTKFVEKLQLDSLQQNCLLVGEVIGLNATSRTLAAIDACEEHKQAYRGYLQIGNDGYIIQPLPGKDLSGSIAHSLEPIRKSLQNLDVSQDIEKRVKRSDESLDELLSNNEMEWDGYYIGDVWKATRDRNRLRAYQRAGQPFRYHGRSPPSGEVVCNGPYCEYFRVKQDELKWLETAVAIDNSVIKFHGEQTVKQYVLTLLNIVSAIYGDPTLAASLKFVITRLIFYEGIDRNLSPIDPDGNSKKSLENVNAWNENLLNNLPEEQRHDIAIWLTKLNIGGPSGYAPVAGICDPQRSCSLNRDEGLSSAFIIAHELGHILGMSHDGDRGAGNTCQDEAEQGSVMAPMVGATFRYNVCYSYFLHYKR